VLADFNNSTGDPLFDRTLKQALSLDLLQSPFLNLLSDQKVNATLRLMEGPPGEMLTEKTAWEICLRTNSKAVLAGSIANQGERYPIEVKVVDCRTGDTLAAAKAEARDRNQVLNAVGQIGSWIPLSCMPRDIGSPISSEMIRPCRSKSLGQKAIQ